MSKRKADEDLKSVYKKKQKVVSKFTADKKEKKLIIKEVDTSDDEDDEDDLDVISKVSKKEFLISKNVIEELKKFNLKDETLNALFLKAIKFGSLELIKWFVNECGCVFDEKSISSLLSIRSFGPNRVEILDELFKQKICARTLMYGIREVLRTQSGKVNKMCFKKSKETMIKLQTLPENIVAVFDETNINQALVVKAMIYINLNFDLNSGLLDLFLLLDDFLRTELFFLFAVTAYATNATENLNFPKWNHLIKDKTAHTTIYKILIQLDPQKTQPSTRLFERGETPLNPPMKEL